MDFILSLLPIIVIGAMIALLVFTIKDALKMKRTSKYVYIFIMVLTVPIGSIAYLIMDPRSRE